MSPILLILFYEFDIPSRACIPGMHVAFIDAVDLSAQRRSDVFMREKEFTKTWIQSKSVHAVACGVDHHRARTVNEIASGNLVDALLKAVFNFSIGRVIGDSAVD